MTGSELARSLEVSLRTVYRDIQALVGIGIPITGEAGVGYRLEAGYFLPPLNLTPEEAEMLAFGARILQSSGDTVVAQNASSALAKIRAVLSREAQAAVDRDLFSAPHRVMGGLPQSDLCGLRRAIASRRVIEIEYTVRDRHSIRSVRPLSLSFFGVWFLVGWCETTGDFGLFRLDRIRRTTPTGRPFQFEVGKRFADYDPRSGARC